MVPRPDPPGPKIYAAWRGRVRAPGSQVVCLPHAASTAVSGSQNEPPASPEVTDSVTRSAFWLLALLSVNANKIFVTQRITG